MGQHVQARLTRMVRRSWLPGGGKSARIRSWSVVLAGEVGGRGSPETSSFLSQLASAKSRHEPCILRQRVQQAWRSRWQAILSCAAAKAVARSLLELRTTAGADGDTPVSHDVLRDFAGSVEEA